MNFFNFSRHFSRWKCIAAVRRIFFSVIPSFTPCLPCCYQLSNIQSDAIGLGNKHSSYSFIQSCTIHIYCCTKRQHKTTDAGINFVMLLKTTYGGWQSCRAGKIKKKNILKLSTCHWFSLLIYSDSLTKPNNFPFWAFKSINSRLIKEVTNSESQVNIWLTR